jgi:hypothetical protein
MRYERVLVTPALAEKWLGQNAENQRNEKRSKIPMYARDMASGRWNSDTGETIKFSTANVLIDGQNRLQAVILAGTAIEFDVAFDVPKEAMLVIDSGASRTAADALKVAGASSRFTAGALVRWVICWDARNFMAARGQNVAPTISEIWDRYQVEPAVFDAAATRAADCRQRGVGTASPLGTGFYLAHRIDPESAHQFFDHLITGADLPEGHPVLTLRNRLVRSKLDRLKVEEQLAMFVRAWNAYRAGNTLDRIFASNRGPLSNGNFPQPK